MSRNKDYIINPSHNIPYLDAFEKEVIDLTISLSNCFNLTDKLIDFIDFNDPLPIGCVFYFNRE